MSDSSTTATTDEQTWSVTRTVRVEAPRELVWEALTSPAQIGQWFGDRAEFPGGVAPGAEGVLAWEAHGEFPARIEQVEPYDLFAFTWGSPGEPIRADNATTATFTLRDVEDGAAATEVRVVETGFDALSDDVVRRRAAMADNAEGWTQELDELVDYTESLAAGREAAADLTAGTIVRSVRIAAPRSTTWRVLTDPAAIEDWWGHPAVFADGLTEGADGTFEWVGHGLMPMRVVRAEPERRLDLLWGGLGDPEPGPDASLVEFRVVAVGVEESVVTVVETGFTGSADKRAAMEDNVDGWNAVLASLGRYVGALAA